MAEMLLNVSGVVAAYGHNAVLHNASLSLSKGQILGVIGPNGAGKTTLMRSIFGLIKLEEGRVEFDGEDISTFSVRDRMRLGIACVPQERNVFANLTVIENLQIATSALNCDITERGQRIARVLSLFPRLHERQQQLAGTMSGGEQRMVAIGIGLMAAPRLLILDEPTTGLAPQVVHQLMMTIKTLNSEHGISAVVVEQNILSLLKIVDAVDLVKGGRVTRHKGEPSDLARKDIWEFL
jgi:branched-chain amino acid transport system ATP-binding protein